MSIPKHLLKETAKPAIPKSAQAKSLVIFLALAWVKTFVSISLAGQSNVLLRFGIFKECISVINDIILSVDSLSRIIKLNLDIIIKLL